jgi:lipoyl-dependent peroxiredoxin
MKRSATANWKGGLKAGKGTFSSASGTFSNVPYDFAQRFETGVGTSPEELIAAAHASCFAMALSAELEKVDLAPENIDSKATVTLEKGDNGFAVTSSHLEVTVKLGNPDRSKFERAAEGARAGCPISKLISSAKITLDAKLA